MLYTWMPFGALVPTSSKCYENVSIKFFQELVLSTCLRKARCDCDRTRYKSRSREYNALTRFRCQRLPMPSTKQARSLQAISLKGSCDIVTEFFKYGVNMYVFLTSTQVSMKSTKEKYRILFQRGVYPSDDFHMVKKYGQTVLVTQDLALENYLDRYVHDQCSSCGRSVLSPLNKSVS